MDRRMTKKEFKRAMQCGLGRCVQELKSTNDIEKYRDIVLWGCTRNLSYDAQCEGTRSNFLYQLVNCYPDASPFINAVIPLFYKSMDDAGWTFLQFCRFLGLFAGDKNPAACHALKQGYRQLYDILKNKKRRLPNGTCPECDNFTELCITIVNTTATKEACENVYLRITEDLGLLIMENPLFNWCSFEWFQRCWEMELGKSRIRSLLKKQSRKSKGIAAYHNAMLKEEHARTVYSAERQERAKNLTASSIYAQLQEGKTVGKDLPILLAYHMLKKGQLGEAQKLATYYQKETDVSTRIQLLWLLKNRWCAYLLDARDVIHDSQSSDAVLQEQAFDALGNIKDDEVHQYALDLIQRGAHLEDSIYMLAENYQKADHDIFISMMKKLPVTYHENTVSWHGPYMAALDIFRDSSIKSPPKDLLPYLYEHTLCSFCRESIVREMHRRRMLTEELLRECVYDSNNKIRDFAEHILTERAKKV